MSIFNNLSLATFILSAFWHGFYPSYYILFIMYHFGMELQRLVYKNSDILKGLPGTPLYYAVSILEQIVYAFVTNGGIHVFTTLGFKESYTLQYNTFWQVLIPPLAYFSVKSIVRELKKKNKNKVSDSKKHK